MSFLPRRCLNYADNEAARALRLSDRTAEYISFKQISGEQMYNDEEKHVDNDPVEFNEWKNFTGENCN